MGPVYYGVYIAGNRVIGRDCNSIGRIWMGKLLNCFTKLVKTYLVSHKVENTQMQVNFVISLEPARYGRNKTNDKIPPPGAKQNCLVKVIRNRTGNHSYTFGKQRNGRRLRRDVQHQS